MKHADLPALILMAAMFATILVWLWRARRGRLPYVRRIAGIDAIEEAIGRATEMARPVIFGMGWTDIRQIQTHAALAILGHVARLTARMNTELIALVRQPNVFPVTEEIAIEQNLWHLCRFTRASRRGQNQAEFAPKHIGQIVGNIVDRECLVSHAKPMVLMT